MKEKETDTSEVNLINLTKIRLPGFINEKEIGS